MPIGVCNQYDRCGKSFDSAETLDSYQRFEHSESGHSKPPAGVN
jgi:hypothetical protein